MPIGPELADLSVGHRVGSGARVRGRKSQLAAPDDEREVVRKALADFVRTNRVAVDGWTRSLAERLYGWLLDHTTVVVREAGSGRVHWGPRARATAVSLVARLGLVPTVAALGRGDRAGFERIVQRIHRDEGLARELIEFALRRWMEVLHSDADHAGKWVARAGDGTLGREAGAAGVSADGGRIGVAGTGSLSGATGSGAGAGEVFCDPLRSGDDGSEMVVIPRGEFIMGSYEGDDEKPRHRVVFAQAFALGVYAVTFEEYARFALASGAERPSDGGWGRGRRPVIVVSWEDAQAYAAWLSEETGAIYRLPSESEWEYAARAGTTTRYHWGDEIGTSRANCEGSGSPWGGRQTAPVGSFAPNPWGLYDMHGNVWEWTQDRWNYSYAGAPSDGSARFDGDRERRVLRGGSWESNPGGVRAANRDWDTTGYRGSNTGFRVARTLTA